MPLRDRPDSADVSRTGVSGRRKRRPSPFADLPGAYNPGTGQVNPLVPKRKRPAPPREILRRQRLLRSLGYKIIADGIWGPRSQRAWRDYLTRRKPGGDLANSPLRPETRRSGRPLPLSPGRETKPDGVGSAVTPQEAARERQRQKQIAQEQARRERVKQQIAQRQAVLDRAAQIKANPLSARQLTLRQLTEVIVDRESKLGLDTKAGATAVQSWLRAHGIRGPKGQLVKITGVYNKQTHDALETTMQRAQRNEARARARSIANELYGRAGVKPGDKPAWFPLAGGIPDPDELDKIIQQGGFTASVVLKSLLGAGMANKGLVSWGSAWSKNPQPGPAAFNQWRQAELLRLAAKHSPIIAQMQALGMPVDQLFAFAAIYGANDLMPLPDLEGLHPSAAKMYLEARQNSKQVREENAVRVRSLRGRAKAIATATDAKDFQAKMLAQMSEEEREYTEFQKKMAQGSLGWWGEVADAVLWPGEKMRTGWLWASANAPRYEMVNGIPTPLPPKKYTSWQEAETVIDEMNPVARFAFEVVVDPLNFIPFGRITSTMMKAGTRAASLGAHGEALGSYAITHTGSRFWERALVYNKGTWKARAVVDNAVTTRWSGTAVGKAYDNMLEHGKKLGQLREQAVMNASTRIANQMRHGFKKPTDPVAAKDWTAKNLPTRIQSRLDELLPEVEAQIERAPEFSRLLSAATDEQVSLYLTSDRKIYSQVGASLLPNMTEKARVSTIHQLATDSADDVSEVLRAQGVDDATRVLRLNEEYSKIVGDAGFYIAGGTGLAPESKLLRGELDDRVFSKMDELEHIILPALQNIIERRLAARGISLWDEAGMWAFRDAAASGSLRRLARESFDEGMLDDVPNPAAGIGHTEAEMLSAIEYEVRRRTPRLFAYQARNAAAGTLPEGWSADVAAEEIRQEVLKSWKKHADGLYYDERPTVQISRLYARQLANAYAGVASAGKVKSRRELDELAEMPEFLIAGGGLDDDLWQAMWMLGSRYGSRRDITHATRISHGPDPAMGKDAVNLARERGLKLNESIAQLKIALSEAADHSLSWELAKEHLYMVALAKAQSRYAKSIYFVLYSSLAAWRFATLPLRPGWVVRNTIDNVTKLLIAGVRDPRYFMYGGEGQPGKSVFDSNLRDLMAAARFLDRMFDTKAAEALEAATARIWDLQAAVVNNIFKGHGMPEVPEIVLEKSRLRMGESGDSGTFGVGNRPANPLRITDNDRQLATGEPGPLPSDVPSLGDRLVQKIVKTPDLLWDLMADKPESYMKRVLYRSEYDRVMREAKPMFTRVRQVPNRPTGATAQESADAAALGLDLPVETTGLTPRDLLVDHHAVQKMARSMGVPENVVFKLEFVPKWSLSEREQDLINGEYRHELREAVVEIPTSMLEKATTEEQIDALTQEIVNVAIHEMRHAWQQSKSWGEKIMLSEQEGFFGVWDELPMDTGETRLNLMRSLYGMQLHEIDANLAAKLLRRRHRGLIHYVGPDVSPLVDDVALSSLAHETAWDQVVKYLFDYDKISVVEDNFKLFFPFIQFWRKNTDLWIREFASKPWLVHAVLEFDDARRDAHSDLPPWMRRYIHRDEVVDAAGSIPGLDVVVDAILPKDAMLDPLSMLSFTPLHRAYRELFYGDNPNMPGENPGLAIIAPMLDAMNEWGLMMNPIIRKPLEAAGIATERSWQSIFPQTPMVTALTRHFLGNSAALKAADWESAFGRLPLGVDSDKIAENFEFYVQQEIAGQVARGEEPSRAKAEATIRAWFLIQNTWGYFGGIYFRRATPEDIYLSKLASGFGGDYEDMTDREKNLLKLWGMRGMDRATYDRYLDMAPLVEAYYRLETPAEKAAMVEEYPELRRYVSAEFRGKPWGGSWMRNMRRYSETQRFFTALQIIESIDPPQDVRDAAMDMFASPELRRHWEANDTPKDIREKQIKGETFRYYRELNAAYFSIPDNDFEARDGFLREHPELIRHWNRNNDPAEDYSAILSNANAALREAYFAIVESYSDENEGFKAAADFLRRYPFMFEDTKSAHKVDEETGEWIQTFDGARKKGWSKARYDLFVKVKDDLNWFFDVQMKQLGEDKAWAWLREAAKNGNQRAALLSQYLNKYAVGDSDWSAERREAFLQAKPHLQWFFDTFMPKVGSQKAFAWLNSSETEAATIIKDYLSKYGKKSQKALDYMKAKRWLKLYFDMPPDERRKWLDGGSEGAKIAQAYFDKYGNSKGAFAHAEAYEKAKAHLDYYFSLSKEKRSAWLNAGSPAAQIVLDYFKTYGKQSQMQRAFEKKNPWLVGGSPEQRKRIEFWTRFFALTPDKRPAFVIEHAEEYGVFIYGEFGEEQRHDDEMRWMRRAVGLPKSDRQRAFLYVKPLLDFYQTLGKDEKALFLRANPELQEYFTEFSRKSVTGNKKLDGLVEQYFSLPPDSFARSKFLKDHPEVQDWFDNRSSPAERAMRNVLEQYFAISDRIARQSFLDAHPEISAYFEQRREEKANEASIYQAFDSSDPRLRPFFETAADMERAAAAMRRKLRQAALDAVGSIDVRRERRPARPVG